MSNDVLFVSFTASGSFYGQVRCVASFMRDVCLLPPYPSWASGIGGRWGSSQYPYSFQIVAVVWIG
jgi:hypothetical protein